MTIYNDIPLALQTATKTLLNGMGVPDNLIDWDADIPFKGAPSTDYIEVRHFRNANQSPTWDVGSVFLGFWQISVVSFKQKGEIPALVIAGQIATTFDRAAEFWQGTTRVQISGKPNVLTVVQEGMKASYPVSIPYRCTG